MCGREGVMCGREVWCGRRVWCVVGRVWYVVGRCVVGGCGVW